MADRIVSIGLLTERDLERLGSGFQRHFPVTSDDMFADLMAKLDKVPFGGRAAAKDHAGKVGEAEP